MILFYCSRRLAGLDAQLAKHSSDLAAVEGKIAAAEPVVYALFTLPPPFLCDGGKKSTLLCDGRVPLCRAV